MYRGAECRETLRLSHTKANIKYAERLRGEILNAIELGTFDYAKYFPDSPMLLKFGGMPRSKRVTVGDLLDTQLELYQKTLAPSTLTTYTRSIEAEIRPKWGSTLVTELAPAGLRAWIAEYEMKARSLRQLLIPLRGALELAVNDDIIESNPLDRVKLKKILDRESYKVKHETDPFNAQEIAALLAIAEPQVRNVFQFAFCTGMRPSEYILLKWDSIDWLGMQVKVERARVMGVSSEDLKTKSSRRMIDLRKGAHDALLAQKKYSYLAGDTVFFDPATGKGWDNTKRLGIYWRAMMKKAGVRYRNPYQTRHTFASTLLSTGENQMYVAKQMGHTDTTMITRTYGRWLELEGGTLPDMYLEVPVEKLKISG